MINGHEKGKVAKITPDIRPGPAYVPAYNPLY